MTAAVLRRRLILLAGTTAGIVTFTDALPSVRPFVMLPFLILGPGMAWVQLLRLDSPLMEFTLAVALSLALAASVAAGMLYAGAWSPRGSLAILLALTLVAVALDLGTGRRQRRRQHAGS